MMWMLQSACEKKRKKEDLDTETSPLATTDLENAHLST